MAMHTSYYDTSGAEHDQDAVVTVGLAGTVRTWARFERNWRRVLQEPQFRIPFVHMSDLVAGREAPFKHFKNNDPLIQELSKQLFAVIRRDSYFQVSGINVES